MAFSSRNVGGGMGRNNRDQILSMGSMSQDGSSSGSDSDDDDDSLSSYAGISSIDEEASFLNRSRVSLKEQMQQQQQQQGDAYSTPPKKESTIRTPRTELSAYSTESDLPEQMVRAMPASNPTTPQVSNNTSQQQRQPQAPQQPTKAAYNERQQQLLMQQQAKEQQLQMLLQQQQQQQQQAQMQQQQQQPQGGMQQRMQQMQQAQAMQQQQAQANAMQQRMQAEAMRQQEQQQQQAETMQQQQMKEQQRRMMQQQQMAAQAMQPPQQVLNMQQQEQQLQMLQQQQQMQMQQMQMQEGEQRPRGKKDRSSSVSESSSRKSRRSSVANASKGDKGGSSAGGQPTSRLERMKAKALKSANKRLGIAEGQNSQDVSSASAAQVLLGSPPKDTSEAESKKQKALSRLDRIKAKAIKSANKELGIDESTLAATLGVKDPEGIIKGGADKQKRKASAAAKAGVDEGMDIEYLAETLGLSPSFFGVAAPKRPKKQKEGQPAAAPASQPIQAAAAPQQAPAPAAAPPQQQPQQPEPAFEPESVGLPIDSSERETQQETKPLSPSQRMLTNVLQKVAMEDEDESDDEGDDQQKNDDGEFDGVPPQFGSLAGALGMTIDPTSTAPVVREKGTRKGDPSLIPPALSKLPPGGGANRTSTPKKSLFDAVMQTATVSVARKTAAKKKEKGNQGFSPGPVAAPISVVETSSPQPESDNAKPGSLAAALGMYIDPSNRAPPIRQANEPVGQSSSGANNKKKSMLDAVMSKVVSDDDSLTVSDRSSGDEDFFETMGVQAQVGSLASALGMSIDPTSTAPPIRQKNEPKEQAIQLMPATTSAATPKKRSLFDSVMSNMTKSDRGTVERAIPASTGRKESRMTRTPQRVAQQQPVVATPMSAPPGLSKAKKNLFDAIISTPSTNPKPAQQQQQAGNNAQPNAGSLAAALGMSIDPNPRGAPIRFAPSKTTSMVDELVSKMAASYDGSDSSDEDEYSSSGNSDDSPAPAEPSGVAPQAFSLAAALGMRIDPTSTAPPIRAANEPKFRKPVVPPPPKKPKSLMDAVFSKTAVAKKTPPAIAKATTKPEEGQPRAGSLAAALGMSIDPNLRAAPIRFAPPKSKSVMDAFMSQMVSAEDGSDSSEADDDSSESSDSSGSSEEGAVKPVGVAPQAFSLAEALGMRIDPTSTAPPIRAANEPKFRKPVVPPPPKEPKSLMDAVFSRTSKKPPPAVAKAAMKPDASQPRVGSLAAALGMSIDPNLKAAPIRFAPPKSKSMMDAFMAKMGVSEDGSDSSEADDNSDSSDYSDDSAEGVSAKKVGVAPQYGSLASALGMAIDPTSTAPPIRQTIEPKYAGKAQSQVKPATSAATQAKKPKQAVTADTRRPMMSSDVKINERSLLSSILQNMIPDEGSQEVAVVQKQQGAFVQKRASDSGSGSSASSDSSESSGSSDSSESSEEEAPAVKVGVAPQYGSLAEALGMRIDPTSTAPPIRAANEPKVIKPPPPKEKKNLMDVIFAKRSTSTKTTPAKPVAQPARQPGGPNAGSLAAALGMTIDESKKAAPIRLAPSKTKSMFDAMVMAKMGNSEDGSDSSSDAQSSSDSEENDSTPRVLPQSGSLAAALGMAIDPTSTAPPIREANESKVVSEAPPLSKTNTADSFISTPSVQRAGLTVSQLPQLQSMAASVGLSVDVSSIAESIQMASGRSNKEGLMLTFQIKMTPSGETEFVQVPHQAQQQARALPSPRNLGETMMSTPSREQAAVPEVKTGGHPQEGSLAAALGMAVDDSKKAEPIRIAPSAAKSKLDAMIMERMGEDVSDSEADSDSYSESGSGSESEADKEDTTPKVLPQAGSLAEALGMRIDPTSTAPPIRGANEPKFRKPVVPPPPKEPKNLMDAIFSKTAAAKKLPPTSAVKPKAVPKAGGQPQAGSLAAALGMAVDESAKAAPVRLAPSKTKSMLDAMIMEKMGEDASDSEADSDSSSDSDSDASSGSGSSSESEASAPAVLKVLPQNGSLAAALGMVIDPTSTAPPIRAANEPKFRKPVVPPPPKEPKNLMDAIFSRTAAAKKLPPTSAVKSKAVPKAGGQPQAGSLAAALGMAVDESAKAAPVRLAPSKTKSMLDAMIMEKMGETEDDDSESYSDSSRTASSSGSDSEDEKDFPKVLPQNGSLAAALGMVIDPTSTAPPVRQFSDTKDMARIPFSASKDMAGIPVAASKEAVNDAAQTVHTTEAEVDEEVARKLETTPEKSVPIEEEDPSKKTVPEVAVEEPVKGIADTHAPIIEEVKEGKVDEQEKVTETEAAPAPEAESAVPEGKEEQAQEQGQPKDELDLDFLASALGVTPDFFAMGASKPKPQRRAVAHAKNPPSAAEVRPEKKELPAAVRNTQQALAMAQMERSKVMTGQQASLKDSNAYEEEEFEGELKGEDEPEVAPAPNDAEDDSPYKDPMMLPIDAIIGMRKQSSANLQGLEKREKAPDVKSLAKAVSSEPVVVAQAFSAAPDVPVPSPVFEEGISTGVIRKGVPSNFDPSLVTPMKAPAPVFEDEDAGLDLDTIADALGVPPSFFLNPQSSKKKGVPMAPSRKQRAAKLAPSGVDSPVNGGRSALKVPLAAESKEVDSAKADQGGNKELVGLKDEMAVLMSTVTDMKAQIAQAGNLQSTTRESAEFSLKAALAESEAKAAGVGAYSKKLEEEMFEKTKSFSEKLASLQHQVSLYELQIAEKTTEIKRLEDYVASESSSGKKAPLGISTVVGNGSDERGGAKISLSLNEGISDLEKKMDHLHESFGSVDVGSMQNISANTSSVLDDIQSKLRKEGERRKSLTQKLKAKYAAEKTEPIVPPTSPVPAQDPQPMTDENAADSTPEAAMQDGAVESPPSDSLETEEVSTNPVSEANTTEDAIVPPPAPVPAQEPHPVTDENAAAESTPEAAVQDGVVERPPSDALETEAVSAEPVIIGEANTKEGAETPVEVDEAAEPDVVVVVEPQKEAEPDASFANQEAVEANTNGDAEAPADHVAEEDTAEPDVVVVVEPPKVAEPEVSVIPAEEQETTEPKDIVVEAENEAEPAGEVVEAVTEAAEEDTKKGDEDADITKAPAADTAAVTAEVSDPGQDVTVAPAIPSEEADPPVVEPEAETEPSHDDDLQPVECEATPEAEPEADTPEEVSGLQVGIPPPDAANHGTGLLVNLSPSVVRSGTSGNPDDMEVRIRVRITVMENNLQQPSLQVMGTTISAAGGEEASPDGPEALELSSSQIVNSACENEQEPPATPTPSSQEVPEEAQENVPVEDQPFDEEGNNCVEVARDLEKPFDEGAAPDALEDEEEQLDGDDLASNSSQQLVDFTPEEQPETPEENASGDVLDECSVKTEPTSNSVAAAQQTSEEYYYQEPVPDAASDACVVDTETSPAPEELPEDNNKQLDLETPEPVVDAAISLPPAPEDPAEEHVEPATPEAVVDTEPEPVVETEPEPVVETEPEPAVEVVPEVVSEPAAVQEDVVVVEDTQKAAPSSGRGDLMAIVALVVCFCLIHFGSIGSTLPTVNSTVSPVAHMPLKRAGTKRSKIGVMKKKTIAAELNTSFIGSSNESVFAPLLEDLPPLEKTSPNPLLEAMGTEEAILEAFTFPTSDDNDDADDGGRDHNNIVYMTKAQGKMHPPSLSIIHRFTRPVKIQAGKQKRGVAAGFQKLTRAVRKTLQQQVRS